MKILLILIISILVNCQTAQTADTARIQERSEAVTTNLDNAANDCLTENCKQAMKQAKELINDSLDVMTDKDIAIIQLQKKIQKEKFYADLGRFIFWGVVVFIFGILIYIFRDNIIALIKIAKPI